MKTWDSTVVSAKIHDGFKYTVVVVFGLKFETTYFPLSHIYYVLQKRRKTKNELVYRFKIFNVKPKTNLTTVNNMLNIMSHSVCLNSS